MQNPQKVPIAAMLERREKEAKDNQRKVMAALKRLGIKATVSRATNVHQSTNPTISSSKTVDILPIKDALIAEGFDVRYMQGAIGHWPRLIIVCKKEEK